MDEITRGEFLEQLTAFERRIHERFDLLERLMALGFDDTNDQIKLRFGELDIVRETATNLRGPLTKLSSDVPKMTVTRAAAEKSVKNRQI